MFILDNWFLKIVPKLLFDQSNASEICFRWWYIDSYNFKSEAELLGSVLPNWSLGTIK